MTLISLVKMIILIYYTNGQSFTLCAYGHTTPNKYIAGKTTYFKSQPDRWSTLWTSYNHPPETPNMTYIYEDWSRNTSCWSFGSTSSVWNIINEDYDQITKFASCSVCDSASVPYPEYCPLWDIIGYGLDSNFKISTNEVCQADNWNNTNHNYHIPLSICSWNISSDEYYFMNDETWYLYTKDTNNNTYYYNPDDVQYMYQYYDLANDEWLWAVSHFVGDANYKIFCQMTQLNEDISQCKTWHFYDQHTAQFHSNYNLILQPYECPSISDTICVYDSSKAQFNGEYQLKAYQNNYDGWKKDNLYLIYRDLWWHITSVDVSIIYASCSSLSPYDAMECNNKWRLYNKNLKSLSSSFDTLQIWNSTCDTVPTSLPTTPPTTANPTSSPTHKPTIAPSYIAPIISTIKDILATRNSLTTVDVINIATNSVNITSSTEITTASVPLLSYKDYYDDVQSGDLSTDTFVIMLAIGVIVFICFFFGLCGIIYYCKRSHKDRKHDNHVYEQPRFRETIDEYMTQHLQEKVDRCLQKSADINQKAAVDKMYNNSERSPVSPFINEGKQLYGKHRLYPEQMAHDSTQYPTTEVWNDGAMIQSYDSQQQSTERRMTNEARAHCEYSSESIDINNGANIAGYDDNMHKYDLTQYDIDQISSTASDDVAGGKKNSTTHLYHIVIDEEDVLNEEEFNRQIDAHHENGMLSRKSIGDQSVLSRITDASFGSNQTEEKEDHAFYNKQQYNRLSKEMLSKQPLEAAIFPEDVEGAETIERVVITPAVEELRNGTRTRESIQMDVASPKETDDLKVPQSVRERKSLNMTPRGYMDDECDKMEANKADIENDKTILNIISPRRHKTPPNTEIFSPSTSNMMCNPNEASMDIAMDTILDLKQAQHPQDQRRKSMELNTPKEHVIQSLSKRSGRSFVTLFDEKKDIEADHLEIDSDDTCIDGVESVDNDDEDDLDVDYDLESNTDDLSKQLFGSRSVTAATEIMANNAAPCAYQHTLQSHIMHNTYYNNHAHNHLAYKRIESNSNHSRLYSNQSSQCHHDGNLNEGQSAD